MKKILELTTDISNGMHNTGNGVMRIIIFFLMKIKYILTVEFQIDKAGGEIGIC